MSNALNLGNIVLPGDNYPSIFGFNIPVTSGLEGAYLFGDGSGQVARNYAPGKANAAIVGTLAPVGAGFATFSDAGYINTGISETAEMTLITVSRDSTGTADPIPGYIGNNFSVAGGGTTIISGSPTTLRGSCVKINATLTPPAADVEFISAAGNPATFTAQSFRAKNAAPSLMNNLSTGLQVVSTNSGVRVLETNYPIWIGRIPSNSFKGFNDQVAALVFSRALGDAELALLMTWLRGYCASKGIAI